jgi:hypothetical protein
MTTFLHLVRVLRMCESPSCLHGVQRAQFSFTYFTLAVGMAFTQIRMKLNPITSHLADKHTCGCDKRSLSLAHTIQRWTFDAVPAVNFRCCDITGNSAFRPCHRNVLIMSTAQPQACLRCSDAGFPRSVPSLVQTRSMFQKAAHGFHSFDMSRVLL